MISNIAHRTKLNGMYNLFGYLIASTTHANNTPIQEIVRTHSTTVVFNYYTNILIWQTLEMLVFVCVCVWAFVFGDKDTLDLDMWRH